MLPNFPIAPMIDDNSDIMKWVLDSLYLTLIVDDEGIIRYVSKGYAEMLGWTSSDMMGHPIKEFLPATKTAEFIQSGEQKMGQVFEIPDGRTVTCNYIPVRDVWGTVKAVLVTSTLNSHDAVVSLYSEVKELQKDNELYVKQLQGLHRAALPADAIVGKSKAIKSIKKTVERIANTNMPILLTGESGCGKEVFANAIHNISDRNQHPFIKINCAAIPKDLLESELFGYEAGTFSGASKGGKAGKFELANNGSILLDEVGELPLNMQSKLLRVLQEYEVERIGGIKTIPLNIRLICCTNRDLKKMVEDGTFREDLYYRINVMCIEIPPLRERKEDIPELCSFFIARTNKNYHISIKGITDRCIKMFLGYSWPGNIRQLQHALERASVLTDKDELDTEDFEFLNIGDGEPETESDLSVKRDMAERDAILQELTNSKWQKTKAARELGISRSQLYSKMRKYGIDEKYSQ